MVGGISAKAESRGIVVTEASSYSRRIDSCITQIKAQGPSRTCNESKEEEEDYSQVDFRVSSANPSTLGRKSAETEIGWPQANDGAAEVQVPCRHSRSDFTQSRPLVEL